MLKEPRVWSETISYDWTHACEINAQIEKNKQNIQIPIRSDISATSQRALVFAFNKKWDRF